jgi:hypothetical protein
MPKRRNSKSGNLLASRQVPNSKICLAADGGIFSGT